MDPLSEVNRGRRRPANVAANIAAIVSAACAVTALFVARPWVGYRSADSAASTSRATAGPAGNAIAADAAAGSRLAPQSVMLALQPRIGASPRLDGFGPPTRLVTTTGGAQSAAPKIFDPIFSERVPAADAGGFGAIRLTISVAACVLALLSVAQLVRLAIASRRGELFSPEHGIGLRRLAWLTLVIGLADLCSVALQIGFGGWGAVTIAVDVAAATAATLTSMFLFFFAHAVSEGAKLADDHLHTV